MVGFGKQPFYCELDGLFCSPEPGSIKREIYDLLPVTDNFSQIRSNLPRAAQEFCNERNLPTCNTEPVFGFRMVNAYTNINLRIHKKIGEHIELFAGVDNLLEEYDLVYNPQRPRFFISELMEALLQRNKFKDT